jgi:hypothetical protein
LASASRKARRLRIASTFARTSDGPWVSVLRWVFVEFSTVRSTLLDEAAERRREQ